jgi:tetratricopeptide (TPR) repeat protein
MERKNSELLNISAQAYQKSIELRPFYPISYRNLGQLFFDAGELELAESYAKKSIEIEPNYIMAHYLLGLIYEKAGRINQAVSEYEAARGLWTRFKDARPDNDYERKLLAADIEEINRRLASVQPKPRK